MPSASNPPRSSWFSLFVKCHLFLSLLLLHIVLYPDYLTWVPLPVLLWRMDGGPRGKKWRPFDLLRMSNDPNAILVYPTSPRRCVWYVLKNGTATFWHFLGVMFAGSPKSLLQWFTVRLAFPIDAENWNKLKNTLLSSLSTGSVNIHDIACARKQCGCHCHPRAFNMSRCSR